MGLYSRFKMKFRKNFYEEQIISYNQQADFCKQNMKFYESFKLHKKCYEMACDLYGRYNNETLACLNNLGRAYSEIGDYSKALEAAIEVYDNLKYSLPHSSYEYLVICYNLALSYQDIEKHHEALKLFEHCYDLSKKYYGQNNRDTLLYFYSLGIGYKYISEYSKALNIIQETYDLQKKFFGNNDKDTLQSMCALADIYNQLGEKQKAFQILESCYELLKNEDEQLHIEMILTLSHLGKIYLSMKEYLKAKEIFLKVYQIRQKVWGETYIETLNTLNDISIVYFNIGQQQKSLELAEKIYTTVQQYYDQKDTHCLRFLQNYIISLRKTNHLKKAIDLQETLYRLKIEKYRDKDSRSLESLHDLSYLYYLDGQYLKAIEYEEQCYHLREEVLGQFDVSTLESLNQLAQISSEANDYEKALSYCLKAHEIEKKIYGIKNQSYIRTLSQLAQIYFLLAHYDEALKKYEECYKLQKEVFGKQSEDALESLIYMFIICTVTEKLEGTSDNQAKALKLFKQIENSMKDNHSSEFIQVVQMVLSFVSSRAENQKTSLQVIQWLTNYFQQLKQTKGSHHPDTITALFMFAQAYESYDLVKSNQLYRDVYVLSCQVFGSHHMNTLLCLGELALSYNKLHDHELFEMYARRFLEDIKPQIYQYYLLNESSHKTFLKPFIILNQFYQADYFEHHGNGKNYHYLVAYKNIIQDIEMILSRLQQIPQYTDKRKVLDDLNQKINQNIDSSMLLKLQRQRDDIYKEFKDIMAEYQKYLVLDIDLSMISNRLQDDELLLDYYQLLNGKNGVVVIGKNIFESFLVDDYGINKIEKYLKHIQHIYVCPDGNLYHTSFERLINKNISYLSSPKSLFSEENIMINDDVVLFVSPDFNDSLDDDGFDQTRGNGKKSSLPGSLVEGHYIQNIFPDAQIYSGKKANATAFLDVHSPFILHISTHGEYLQDEDNMMERGRLCLAGYNQTNSKKEYKNGYVSANDIQKDMNLKNTNLLVLSACLTAKGEVLPGEGIYGLRRAFEFAGVKTMILTVETINDHNAAVFMKIFYQKFNVHKNAYQAFIETKKYLRDDSQALRELQIYANEFTEYVSKVYPQSYRFIKRHLENYLRLCQTKGYLLRNESDKEDWNGFIIQGKIR